MCTATNNSTGNILQIRRKKSKTRKHSEHSPLKKRERNWVEFTFRKDFWDCYWGVYATTFLSDARQPEVDFLHSSAVVLKKFLGKASL